ncbi:MAG: hypothetical protein HOV94_33130, partial [Saccharothrix sp.]|nr:hypothetical protein [Saccharothrix sp.]
MKWSTGTLCAVVACAVVAGCASPPGRPLSQQAAPGVEAPGSVSPGTTPGTTPGPVEGTTPEATQESAAAVPTVEASPEWTPPPATEAPQATAPYVPPEKPRAPGSPINYNATYFGLPVETAEGFIKDELRRDCQDDPRGELCGITIVTVPSSGDLCFVRATPSPVERGGSITVEGRPCADGTPST